jgi:hypothetical protein
VRDPAVPPTNTAAERGLRSVAIARKVTGGTRFAPGSRGCLGLASVRGMAQVRGDDLTATGFPFLVPGLPATHAI